MLLDAICQATGEPEAFAGYPLTVSERFKSRIRGPNRISLRSLAGSAARDRVCLQTRENDVTLPQLHCITCKMAKLARRSPRIDGRLPKTVGSREKENRRVAEELFLATLGRLPSAEEISLVQASVPNAIATNSAERLEAFTDVQWALMNAKDFAFNH